MNKKAKDIIEMENRIKWIDIDKYGERVIIQDIQDYIYHYDLLRDKMRKLWKCADHSKLQLAYMPRQMDYTYSMKMANYKDPLDGIE